LRDAGATTGHTLQDSLPGVTAAARRRCTRALPSYPRCDSRRSSRRCPIQAASRRCRE
jgi:hypothetical protein